MICVLLCQQLQPHACRDCFGELEPDSPQLRCNILIHHTAFQRCFPKVLLACTPTFHLLEVVLYSNNQVLKLHQRPFVTKDQLHLWTFPTVKGEWILPISVIKIKSLIQHLQSRGQLFHGRQIPFLGYPGQSWLGGRLWLKKSAKTARWIGFSYFLQ